MFKYTPRSVLELHNLFGLSITSKSGSGRALCCYKWNQTLIPECLKLFVQEREIFRWNLLEKKYNNHWMSQEISYLQFRFTCSLCVENSRPRRPANACRFFTRRRGSCLPEGNSVTINRIYFHRYVTLRKTPEQCWIQCTYSQLFYLFCL